MLRCPRSPRNPPLEMRVSRMEHVRRTLLSRPVEIRWQRGREPRQINARINKECSPSETRGTLATFSDCHGIPFHRCQLAQIKQLSFFFFFIFLRIRGRPFVTKSTCVCLWVTANPSSGKIKLTKWWRGKQPLLYLGNFCNFTYELRFTCVYNDCEKDGICNIEAYWILLILFSKWIQVSDKENLKNYDTINSSP